MNFRDVRKEALQSLKEDRRTKAVRDRERRCVEALNDAVRHFTVTRAEARPQTWFLN
jgi:hypothetical protein